MNAPNEHGWIETNRQALSGELDGLRRLLRKATGDGDDITIATSAVTAPVLDFLCEQFQLSAFERAVLLLCAGVETEAGITHLCAVLQKDASCDYPTFGLALAVVPEAHWSALSPQAPLRYWHLVEVGDPTRLTASRLHIDESILHYLLGIPALDPRLAPLLRGLPPAETLPDSQRQQAERLCRAWSRVQGSLPLINLRATDPSGARDVASHACAALGLRSLMLRADDISPHPEERTLLARLLARECVLNRCALIIEMEDRQSPHLATFLDQLACPMIVLGTVPAIIQYRSVVLEIRKPLVVEQRALWRSALEDVEGIDDTVLFPVTAHFDFSTQDIAAAAEEARIELHNGASSQTLWRVCRRRARGGLNRLAQLIIPRAGWDDLVLPPAQLAILHDIARQVRHRATVYELWGFAAKSERGLGISALFAGESGTGKTLAAEVLACDLDLDLYRIDLSAVVSKYIGETEKNLEQLFAEAETSGAVLLFDEADALFGKRSVVKDSHDRYANIELAYLLQRMETYRGLSILTTNLKSSLDTAFLRRIRFVAQFPFPDAAQRAEIWERIFPASLPRADLRLDQLARLNVAGGNIRNIALNAAFLAAEDRGCLRMAHLARAARMEYAKLEKPLSEAEIGGWK